MPDLDSLRSSRLVGRVLLPQSPFDASLASLSIPQRAFAASSAFYCLLFASLYEVVGRNVDAGKAARRRSWILTGAASLIVTLISLPYLFDFLASGFDVARVGRREALSEVVIGSFLAYLACDCALGLVRRASLPVAEVQVFYRRHFTLLTGWVHHSLYLACVPRCG